MDREDLVDRADREVQGVRVARVDLGDQKQHLNQEQQQRPLANLEAPEAPVVQEVLVVQEARVVRGGQADQQPRGQVSVRNHPFERSDQFKLHWS